MKKQIYLLALLIGLLTITSCDKQDVISDKAIPIANETGVSNLKRDQAVYNSEYLLKYIGNNRWTGVYAGVTITFSGCTPDDLINHSQCAFFAIDAKGGALLNYTSELNSGSITLANLMGGASYNVTTYVIKYNYIPTENGFILKNVEMVKSFRVINSLTGGGNGIVIPFKIVFINSTPYLVEYQYQSGLPELVE